MAKSISQKNTEKLILQQKTEIESMRETLPVEALRVAEDKLLTQCLDIMEGSLDFASLGFDSKGELDEGQLPAAWSSLSLEQKARKIRLARYACLPSADVPFGVKAAFSTAIGIIKARAQEKSGTKIFNLEVSTFPAPAPLKQDNAIDTEFEVIDIE